MSGDKTVVETRCLVNEVEILGYHIHELDLEDFEFTFDSCKGTKEPRANTNAGAPLL
jgi:hypothetical protein